MYVCMYTYMCVSMCTCACSYKCYEFRQATHYPRAVIFILIHCHTILDILYDKSGKLSP